MKYDVSVDDHGKIKYFQMDVKLQNAEARSWNLRQDDNMESSGESQKQEEKCSAELLNMCLEISRTEYEHSFRRAERLDNKIYILLTVCAFIFVVLINAINKVSECNLEKFIGNAWIYIYGILLVFCILGTVILLGTLIYSLSGAEFRRYDSTLLLEYNMLSEDMEKVTRFTIMKYEKARACNNKIVNKRYTYLNFCVWLLIILVIALIAIAFIGNFLPVPLEVAQNPGPG